MSIKNIIRFGYSWKVLKSEYASNIPLEVSVEVTNVCNFRCAFCRHSEEGFMEKIGRSYMTEESARIILKKIREFGYEKSLIHWSLGGEPFMNPVFDRISKAGVEYGFDNQFFATNATLLSIDKILSLPKNARFTFAVDYCADQDFFEKYRGWPGSWAKIYDNILDVIKNKDIKNVKFNLNDISSFKISDPDLLYKRFEKMRMIFPESTKVEFFEKTYHNAGGYLDWMNNDGGKYHVCHNPWSILAIASNGDVVACDRDIAHHTVLGNVFEEEDLKSIWNGERARALRKSLIDRKLFGVCEGCDMPYDKSKYSFKNVKKTMLNRLQMQNR